MIRRTRLRSKSPVKAKLDREYSQLRREWLAGKLCAVAKALEWPGWRKTPATDVHHLRGRTRLLQNDIRFWLPVSRKGHEWINSHPAIARKLGLLCQPGQWMTSPDR